MTDNIEWPAKAWNAVYRAGEGCEIWEQRADHNDLLVATVDDDAVQYAAAIAELPAMYELIQECAIQFRQYEKLHEAKGTQEGASKAYRNKQFADKCDAILGRIQITDDTMISLTRIDGKA